MSSGPSRRRLRYIGATCVHYNLHRVFRAASRHYDQALRPLGLTATQFGVLTTIAYRGSCGVNEAAELAGIDRTTMTRALAVLGEAGYVSAKAGTDRRRRVISLTRRGRGILEKAIPLRNAAQEEFLKKLGPSKWKSLLRDLRVLEGEPEAGAARIE